MLAASKGAKGLRRFMTLGKDMLSQAPAATGASTTCMRATKHVLSRVAMHIHTGMQQGRKEGPALLQWSGRKGSATASAKKRASQENTPSVYLPRVSIRAGAGRHQI